MPKWLSRVRHSLIPAPWQPGGRRESLLLRKAYSSDNSTDVKAAGSFMAAARFLSVPYALNQGSRRVAYHPQALKIATGDRHHLRWPIPL